MRSECFLRAPCRAPCSAVAPCGRWQQAVSNFTKRLGVHSAKFAKRGQQIDGGIFPKAHGKCIIILFQMMLSTCGIRLAPARQCSLGTTSYRCSPAPAHFFLLAPASSHSAFSPSHLHQVSSVCFECEAHTTPTALAAHCACSPQPLSSTMLAIFTREVGL